MLIQIKTKERTIKPEEALLEFLREEELSWKDLSFPGVISTNFISHLHKSQRSWKTYL